MSGLHESWISSDQDQLDFERSDPSRGWARTKGGRERAGVTAIVEKEIIPRLLLSHAERQRGSSAPVATQKANAPAPVAGDALIDVAVFGFIVVRQPLRLALAEIERLFAQGVTREEAMLRVLAPTAQWLGEMWLQDRLSFFEVTLGMANLQQVIRLLGPDEPLGFGGDDQGRVLLAAVPGEQHTFGLSIIEEFIRMEGWDTQYEVFANHDVLVSRVSSEWFDVIGLSASIDSSVAQLPALAAALRAASLNAKVTIMVGGAAFAAPGPDPAAFGVDHILADARDALRLLRSSFGKRIA